MREMPVATIIHCFEVAPDPRVNRRKRHPLVDIITIAICTETGEHGQGGVKVKRLMPAWDRAYLLKVPGVWMQLPWSQYEGALTNDIAYGII